METDFKSKLAGSSYATENPKKAKGPFLASTAFYSKALSHVWRASRKAKKGTLCPETLSFHSRGVLSAVESSGGRIELEGLENLDAVDGPFILAANHMSSLETFSLPSIVQPRNKLTFVLKQSLLEYPVFGRVLNAMDPIAVSRNNPREDLKAVLNGGKESIAKGWSICVFPQTTRTTVFERAKFNTLAVKLAARSKIPLIPLALKTDFWSNGKRFKDFGPIYTDRTVHMAFGKPLDASDSKGTQEATVEHITSHLKEWGVPCE